jgi:hypothetical protein
MDIEFTAWPKALEYFLRNVISPRRHDQERIVRERARMIGLRI